MGCKEQRNIVNNEENKIKINLINNNIRENSILDINSENSNQTIDYDYFSRPINNVFEDEDLLKMKIIEVLFGIHITTIGGKSKEKGEKSFHPFFYIKLKNKKNIGVIVQYIILPKDDKNIQTHLVEKEGIEYLEKSWSDFEKEYLCFISKVSKESLVVSDWVINYDSIDLNEINVCTLRDFFILINPQSGEWIQSKLKPLTHGCIHFCIDAINKLGIKKDKEEIKDVKNRMKKVLDQVKNSSHYQDYQKGFNNLFNCIERN